MIIGLTGNIGSGKSVAAKIFKEHGYKVIGADELGHQVLNKNRRKLAKLFGKEIINGNTVDRVTLGNIVFYDKEKLRLLNKTIHPLMKKELQNLVKNKKHDYVIDAAVLIKGEWHTMCDKIVLVKAPKEYEIMRLLKEKKYSLEKIKHILKNQPKVEELEKYADYVINNNKDHVCLRKEVLKVIAQIKR